MQYIDIRVNLIPRRQDESSWVQARRTLRVAAPETSRSQRSRSRPLPSDLIRSKTAPLSHRLSNPTVFKNTPEVPAHLFPLSPFQFINSNTLFSPPPPFCGSVYFARIVHIRPDLDQQTSIHFHLLLTGPVPLPSFERSSFPCRYSLSICRP